jgi:ribulose-5-phosphate 4-epimerase/fuculose-1-phosphate aldolase
MNDVDTLRERVAQACRIMGELELAKDATGHASARLPGTDRILIRARGPGELGVRFTTRDQIVEVDLDGRLVASNADGLEAPKEVFIHTAVYRARPDVFGVVHGHPLSVVLLTICNKPLMPLYGAYDPPSARLAIEGIPLYPRSFLCDTPERGEDLAATLGRRRVA